MLTNYPKELGDRINNYKNIIRMKYNIDLGTSEPLTMLCLYEIVCQIFLYDPRPIPRRHQTRRV